MFQESCGDKKQHCKSLLKKNAPQVTFAFNEFESTKKGELEENVSREFIIDSMTKIMYDKYYPNTPFAQLAAIDPQTTEAFYKVWNHNSDYNNKLFGSISLKQVEEELKNKYQITIDKRKFVDKGPLDSLGYYKLKIELYKGVVGEINVHIQERK